MQRYGWSDEWWVAVDGAVLDNRMPLSDACGLKRQMMNRQVSLLHPRAAETTGVQWHPLEGVAAVAPVTAGQPRLAKKSAAPPPVAAQRTSPAAPGASARVDPELIQRTHEQVLEIKADVMELEMKALASLADVRAEVRALKEAFEEMADLRRLKAQLEEKKRMLEQSEQMLIKKAFKQDNLDQPSSPKGTRSPVAANGTAPSGQPAPIATRGEPPQPPSATGRGRSSAPFAPPAGLDLDALLPGRPVVPPAAPGERPSLEKGASKPPPPRRG